jgi:hypothetical protein
MMLRHLVPLALTAPFLACSLSTEPADSLVLEVTVEPPTFQLGDTAMIIRSVRNPTADTIRYETDGCARFFSIEDARGREVAPVDVGCHHPSTIEYAPGEEHVYRYRWFGEPWSGIRREGVPYPFEFLPPGSYTVRAVLPLGSGRRISAPVSVRLLPRE